MLQAGAEVWMVAGSFPPCAGSLVALVIYVRRGRRQRAAYGVDLWRERRLREELEIYSRVDPSLT